MAVHIQSNWQNALSHAINSDTYPLRAHAAVHRLRNRWDKRMVGSHEVDKHLHVTSCNTFLDLQTSLRQRGELAIRPDLLADMRSFIHHAVTSVTGDVLDLRYLFEQWSISNGAVTGTQLRDTSIYEKFHKPPSVTDAARPLLKRFLEYQPEISQLSSWGDISQWRSVPGSKLDSVPKNTTTRRTITIEPSGNMILQLSAGNYLIDALASVGIHIRGQRRDEAEELGLLLLGESVKPCDSTQQIRNRELARLGSLDGRYCTIDLKSASDMITPELVRKLFPTEWYYLFMSLRSPIVKFDGEWFQLTSMSGMGNGFTFPLQTLIFASILYACSLRAKPNRYTLPFGYGVYGDDMICPTDEYAFVTHVLESCGMVVNRDKSFATGFFRESCGGDYVEGVDITPFYIVDLCDANGNFVEPKIYVAINKVVAWCAKTGIILSRTLSYLRSLLPLKPFVVPEWEQPYMGLLSAETVPAYRRFDLSVEPRLVRVDRLENQPKLIHWLMIGGYVRSVRKNGKYVVYTPPRGAVTYKVSPVIDVPNGISRRSAMISSEASKFRELLVRVLAGGAA